MVSEPQQPVDLRPPKRWASSEDTSVLYAAEVVEGHGVEHVKVRYLGAPAAANDELYVLHMSEVALPPEVGEPDEVERKRQRKARKRREQEREAQREAQRGAQREAHGPEAAGADGLPTAKPTALAWPYPEGPLSFAATAPVG